jgi:hypothetical protein
MPIDSDDFDDDIAEIYRLSLDAKNFAIFFKIFHHIESLDMHEALNIDKK